MTLAARRVRVGSVACVGLFLFGGGALGCASRTPHDLQRDNPLGPSFWLVTVPSDDAGLLGRTFERPPDPALSLDEQSTPNPCEAALAAPALAETQNHYENSIRVGESVGGRGFFSEFGFSGRTASASHLLYKLEATKKTTRRDTTAYVECCRQNACGWGYVSALVYGEGEYVSARLAASDATATYSVVTLEGTTRYEALETKRIRGWIAAVLTPHDRTQAVRACPQGERWRAYECVSDEMVVEVNHACAIDQSGDPFWKDNPDMRHQLQKRQEEACLWLDQHELPRPRASE